MIPIYTMKNEPELSKLIWPAFKDRLDEKHGDMGSIGLRGEDAASKIIASGKILSNIKTIIMHEDALHQLDGIDISVVQFNGHRETIDVKTGSTALYYTQSEGWFMTLKDEWYNNVKSNKAFMHLGPKCDVYAYYSRSEMENWYNTKGQSLRPGKYGRILPRRFWPDFIKTNL